MVTPWSNSCRLADYINNNNSCSSRGNSFTFTKKKGHQPESFISRSVAVLVVMSGLKREAVVGPLGLDLTPTPGRSRELALLLGRSRHMLKGDSTDSSLSCGSSLMWTWLEEASTGGDDCCWASECSGDTSVPLRSVEPLSPIREPSPSVSVVSSSFTLTSVRGKCWWQRMWSFRLKWREEVKGQSSHWNVSPRSWCWCTWKSQTTDSQVCLLHFSCPYAEQEL